MKTPLQIAETIASNVIRLGKLIHQAKSDWGLDVYQLGDIVTVKVGDDGYYISIESSNFHLEITYGSAILDDGKKFVYRRAGTEEDLNKLWDVISEKLGLT
jgi:hypothetical protein